MAKGDGTEGGWGWFGVEDVVVVVAFLSLCVAASQALSIILHALFLLRFSLIIFCRPPKGEGGVWGLGGAGRSGRCTDLHVERCLL